MMLGMQSTPKPIIVLFLTPGRDLPDRGVTDRRGDTCLGELDRDDGFGVVCLGDADVGFSGEPDRDICFAGDPDREAAWVSSSFPLISVSIFYGLTEEYSIWIIKVVSFRLLWKI